MLRGEQFCPSTDCTTLLIQRFSKVGNFFHDIFYPYFLSGWINDDSEILVEHHFDQILVTLPAGLTIETRKQRPLKISTKMERGESVFKLVSVHFNGQKVSIERNPKPVQHTEFEVNPFETSSLNIDIKALFVEIE